MQGGIGMVSLESLCEKMYKDYRQTGYPGIGGIGDAGEEWVFIQAPKEKDGELPRGLHPQFINKETGEYRCMVFDVPDINLLKATKQLEVPERFRPVYLS